MEFAVSALFILILLLPGFILQSAYTKGFWRWNSPTSSRSLTEQILSGIVTASILHVIWASICTWIGHPRNLRASIMLLLGSYGHEEEFFDTTISAVTTHPSKVFFYFLSIYFGAAVIGYLSHYIVRSQKLDRKTRFLRFNNEWFYLLRGEVTEFKEDPESYDKVDGVYLTTIVHHGDKDYLYRGIVSDFYFDNSGNLDRVLLELAHRRCLSDDRPLIQERNKVEPDARYYEIEGDFFIIRYSEMCTINLDYFVVEKEESELQAQTTPDSSLPSLPV